jgi:phage gpG-like protein
MFAPPGRHPKLAEMISFSYADNSEAVGKALEAFQGALADNTPALREIADDFREMVAQQFASEGRAGGTPWAPLGRAGFASPSPRGMPAPPRAQRAAPLLVRTGALRDSLTGRGAGSVEEMDATTLTLGSRLPYAIFHQRGTRHMPARPVIVLTDERRTQWTGIVRGAIEEKTVLLGAKQLEGSK